MFLKYPSDRRAIPIRAIIPNLITTVSLCCGLAAIHFASRGEWNRAVAAVGLAAVFDALDGRAARLLRSASPFGAVLDSLADFCSFGVAPAVILHQWLQRPESDLAKPWAGWALVAVMIYALCAALRLARFTAAAGAAGPVPAGAGAARKALPGKTSAKIAAKFFVGMPSPAAAGAVLIPVMIDISPLIKWSVPAWGVVVYTAFIAFLMVSRRPMYSFKKVKLRRGAVVPLLVGVGALVFVASRDPWLATGLLAAVYLATLPLAAVAHARLRRQALAAEAVGGANGAEAIGIGVSGGKSADSRPV